MMNDDALIERIKRSVDCRQFLERSKGGMYCCPFCNSGKNGHSNTGALKVYPDTNTWTCHKCKKSGDVIDLYRHVTGMDFHDAVDALKDQAGPRPPRPVPQRKAPPAPRDFTSYYEMCKANLPNSKEAIEYLERRGIRVGTAYLADIGFDPRSDPANAPGAMGDEYRPHPAPRIIIPTGPEHYVGRSIDPDTPKAYVKINNRSGRPGIFAEEDLYKEADRVFVTEGAFDALSIMELGHYAVALNSTSNVDILLEKLKERPTASTLVICLDSDETGRDASARLMKGLKDLGVKCVSADICGRWKDPNEALTADRAAFKAAVERAEKTEPAAVNDEPAATPEAKETGKIPGAETDKQGNMLNRARNYRLILTHDPIFAHIYLNEMTGSVVIRDGSRSRQWTERDDAAAREHIEATYGIYSLQKYRDGFQSFLSSRTYNPCIEEIERETWDGIPRVENFLCYAMKAEDTVATRESSRLIFSGGIRRAYEPGCKHDEVVVLVSPQGCGKSSLIQWLALRDEFYIPLKTLDGKTAEENIEGGWIVEIDELCGLFSSRKRYGSDDAVKAFLSETKSVFRHAYAREPVQTPRRNIFIATTNHFEFLEDPSGNRRWFPVICRQSGPELYARKDEIRHYIRQCWAEMLTAYRNHDPLADPAPRSEALAAIEAERAKATVDDWRVAEIARYIEGKEKTCILEIWREALHRDGFCPDLTKHDSNEIAQILRQLGWRPADKPEYSSTDKKAHKMYYPPLPFD